MIRDESDAFDQLRDIARQASGAEWTRGRAAIEPELKRLAQTLVLVDAGLREQRLSRSEMRTLLERVLEDMRAALLTSPVLPAQLILRLVSELRSFLLPHEALLADIRPPRAGGQFDFEVGETAEREIRPQTARDRREAPPAAPSPASPDTGAEAEPGLEGEVRADLDRAWGEKSLQQPEVSGDLVDCSLFAPASVLPGDEILVQAFAHLPERADEARAQAKEQDEAATRRGYTTLDTTVARGSMLSFELTLTQATVDEGMQHLRWQGATRYVAFTARIAGTATGKLGGKLIVSQDGVPIGRIVFQVKVSAAATAVARPTGDARRYRKAFISYASKDRTEVLKRVQMLRLHRIDFFQDVLDSSPATAGRRRSTGTSTMPICFCCSGPPRRALPSG